MEVPRDAQDVGKHDRIAGFNEPRVSEIAEKHGYNTPAELRRLYPQRIAVHRGRDSIVRASIEPAVHPAQERSLARRVTRPSG